MADSKDPLSNLLLDADDVDRARLAGALQDILGVDIKTGRVVVKPGFSRLTTRQRLVAYLLGRKVAVLLEKSDTEPVAPKDIQAETGLPKGTVGPKLKELSDARLVSKTDAGEYYVGPHQVVAAMDELKKEESEMTRIDEIVQRALEVAEKLPEKYQLATFTEVLRRGLSSSDDDASDVGRPLKMNERQHASVANAHSYLPDAHLVADNEDRDQQAVWAVMSLCNKGVEADNETIREEISTSLGATPQSRQNTNRTLRRLTPKYLARKKKAGGNGYCYIPSTRALEIFNGLAAD